MTEQFLLVAKVLRPARHSMHSNNGEPRFVRATTVVTRAPEHLQPVDVHARSLVCVCVCVCVCGWVGGCAYVAGCTKFYLQ